MDKSILRIEEDRDGVVVHIAGGYSVVIDTNDMEVRTWHQGQLISTTEMEGY
jgi:hypothetical protein